MVVWRCKVQTHEYPMGRSFILVANDITHIGGSFSPEEDDVYEKVTKQRDPNSDCFKIGRLS